MDSLGRGGEVCWLDICITSEEEGHMKQQKTVHNSRWLWLEKETDFQKKKNRNHMNLNLL